MSAALLIAALIAGKITLSALGVADWALLAQAGFTVAKLGITLGAKIERKVGKLPRYPLRDVKGIEMQPRLCFHGAPSGQGAVVCFQQNS